jgi:molybdopterin molybdotransferase
MPPPLISIHDARELVLRATKRLENERVDVEQALDRVLAEDVVAIGDVPPFPCSAMDGYAISAGPAGRTLRVVGESRAGAPSDHGLEDGEAIRISTGAAIPPGATAVIRQEDVTESENSIETGAPTEPAENVRPIGDDMHAGTTVLKAGTTLGAIELGAAVAAGVAEVVVARRPRIQVLCTGDELRAPGEALGPGEIHNSNAPMLAALASRCGVNAGPVERLPDDRAATEAGLAAALGRADVVVITGGVSVGPHDHVKPALAALGVVEQFWGVALQPGKPTWFGTLDGKLVFGLPGNPVSAVVTFSLFARPGIAALQGATLDGMLTTEAKLAHAVRRNPIREQAIRVRLERSNGAIIAFPNGPQGSNIVTSLVGADALALIPAGPGEIEAGATVALEPLPD